MCGVLAHAIHTACKQVAVSLPPKISKTPMNTGFASVSRSLSSARCSSCEGSRASLETEPKPKKGIMTAKSFGRPVESLAELEEAVATYTARAVEKLRNQGSAASCISVFITTNPFQQDAPQYANSLSRLLPFQSVFTPDV